MRDGESLLAEVRSGFSSGLVAPAPDQGLAGDFGAGLLGSTSPVARAALRLLTPLTRTDGALPLVDALIAEAERDPDACAERAQLSYRHALGFAKIVLMIGAPQYMLRAHVWQASDGDGGAAEHVHNHRFAFASSVMKGELAMTVFGPDPDGAAMSHYREELSPDDGGWVLAAAGETRIGATSELHLPAGVDYFLSPDALHHISPAADRDTVTFCLETESVRRRTDVYTALGAPVPGRIPKEPLTPAAYLDALRALRDLLATP